MWVGSESASLSRNSLYCLFSSNSLNLSSFKTSNGSLPRKSSATSRQTKAPRPVGRGARMPQSETYTKTSPTTIERRWQSVAVYGLGLGMISFPYLVSRSRKDYSPHTQLCQYKNAGVATPYGLLFN